jgi:hypothetical protein
MTTREFYSNKSIINAFGKSNVYETIRYSKEAWEEIGISKFPKYTELLSVRDVAILLFILCNSNKATKKSVTESILKSHTLERFGSIKYSKDKFIDEFSNILGGNTGTFDFLKSITIYPHHDFAKIEIDYGGLMAGEYMVFGDPNQITEKDVIHSVVLPKKFIHDIAKMIYQNN